MRALDHPPTIHALRDYGLLKKFKTWNMKRQVVLLQHLTQMSQPQEKYFIVKGKTL